jgi:hypothetical protein
MAQAGGMEDLLEPLARYDSPTLANAIATFDLQPRESALRRQRGRHHRSRRD